MVQLLVLQFATILDHISAVKFRYLLRHKLMLFFFDLASVSCKFYNSCTLKVLWILIIRYLLIFCVFGYRFVDLDGLEIWRKFDRLTVLNIFIRHLFDFFKYLVYHFLLKVFTVLNFNALVTFFIFKRLQLVAVTYNVLFYWVFRSVAGTLLFLFTIFLNSSASYVVEQWFLMWSTVQDGSFTSKSSNGDKIWKSKWWVVGVNEWSATFRI